MNKALETARTGKLIGSSLEAKVYLHSSDDGLAVRLRNMCESNVEADSLHRIFITSQVFSILAGWQDGWVKRFGLQSKWVRGRHVIFSTRQ